MKKFAWAAAVVFAAPLACTSGESKPGAAGAAGVSATAGVGAAGGAAGAPGAPTGAAAGTGGSAGSSSLQAVKKAQRTAPPAATCKQVGEQVGTPFGTLISEWEKGRLLALLAAFRTIIPRREVIGNGPAPSAVTGEASLSPRR